MSHKNKCIIAFKNAINDSIGNFSIRYSFFILLIDAFMDNLYFHDILIHKYRGKFELSYPPLKRQWINFFHQNTTEIP